MKHVIIFLVLLLTFITNTKAQVPQAFNYSALARDPQGTPLSDSTISIQISILKTNATGPIQYQENHIVTTDTFGVFNLVIGAGAIQSGSISTITWGSDIYFLQVGMDVSGGTNFQTMGTTQLLSVPYALHAATVDSVIGSSVFKHYVGEEFGGGVVFHVFRDAAGFEHGLIVDITTLSSSQVWSNVSGMVSPSAQSSWDGLTNSTNTVAQPTHTSSAAALCLNSTSNGYNDWYLPSAQEFNMLWQNLYNVNRTLSQMPGATIVTRTIYWTSTELDASNAQIFDVSFGFLGNLGKAGIRYVRAVRAF